MEIPGCASFLPEKSIDINKYLCLTHHPFSKKKEKT